MLNSITLSPFVYWGQTSDSVTLIVDLKNVKVILSFQFTLISFVTGYF